MTTSLSPSLASLANIISAGIPVFGVYDHDPVWAAEAVLQAHTFVHSAGRPVIEWTATTSWKGVSTVLSDLGLDKSSTGHGYDLVDSMRALESTLRPDNENRQQRRAKLPSGLVTVWDAERFWDSGAFRYLIPSLGAALKACQATVAFILPEPLPRLAPIASVLPQVAAGGDAAARYTGMLTEYLAGDAGQIAAGVEILKDLPIKVAEAVVALARGVTRSTPGRTPLDLMRIAAAVLSPVRPAGVSERPFQGK